MNNRPNHVEFHNSEIEISEIISYSTDDVESRDSVLPDKTWIMISSLVCLAVSALMATLLQFAQYVHLFSQQSTNNIGGLHFLCVLFVTSISSSASVLTVTLTAWCCGRNSKDLFAHSIRSTRGLPWFALASNITLTILISCSSFV